MEEVKALLRSRYLDIGTYLTQSLKVFFCMFKKEKKWVLPIFLLSGILNTFIIFFRGQYAELFNRNMPQEELEKAISKIMVSRESIIILLLIFAIYIILNIMYDLILRTVIGIIEEGKEISLLKGIFRSIISTIILFGLVFLFLIMLMTGGNSLISMFLFILAFNLIFSFVYFFPMYMSRDIRFIDAVKYNFHLCKKNRWRMIFPILIIYFSSLLISVVINFMAIAGGGISSKIFTYFLNPLIEGASIIFILVTIGVIYLNREYMDIREMYENKNQEGNLTGSGEL